MFKPVKAKSVKEYIGMLTEERRKSIQFLDAFIRKAAPKLKQHFTYNMIGYGGFKYKNYKNEIADWPTVALASQKNYISVYVCSVEKGKYLAEIYKTKLGKVSVGKSCIRFKKIEDVNLKVLEEIIKAAAKSPGLVLK